MKTQQPSSAPGNRPELTVWRNPNPVVCYTIDLKKYNELLELSIRKQQELDNIIQQMGTYARRIEYHVQELAQCVK